MPFSLETIQTELIEYLDGQFVQPFHETGIPDATTVIRVNGKIQPYIAYQFGDEVESGARSFIGPWGHDYQLPLRFQCVAPTAAIARGLKNKLTRVLLGQSFPWSGAVSKRRFGGGTWNIVGSNAATEAYVAPSYFGLYFQMDNSD